MHRNLNRARRGCSTRTTTIPVIFLVAFLLTQTTGVRAHPGDQGARSRENFDASWRFHPGDLPGGEGAGVDDSGWRLLDVPHDWSIEGRFDSANPAGVGGGALPGGLAWYRKTFTRSERERNKLACIEFDGVYRNSEVWINGHYLGKRPYGYSSFQYDLTPYLHYGSAKNVIAVRVDNAEQPNSRWYSGSGIYRNVWLTTTEKVCVDHWGTFVTAGSITGRSSVVTVRTSVRNALREVQRVSLTTVLLDRHGKRAASGTSETVVPADSVCEVVQDFTVRNPDLWSVDSPALYRAVTTIRKGGVECDRYVTTFGIRSFAFDLNSGFSLNGTRMKIRGVCNHHDLGCLGAAVNTRALERQLGILKAMGCNGIRTSHNPPAPELLDLCDRMGFIVMDEAFDMWMKEKTQYDYHLDFAAWHRRDLEDMVLRDRNHPSVFLWSIGNEINEQWDAADTSGRPLARELVGIIKHLDTTRPVTSNCNNGKPDNNLILSGALDIVGFSYAHNDYQLFPKNFPGQKLIGSETTSALESRGHYDMPSDSIRRWPLAWDKPFVEGNADNSVSAYDNVSAPWGATHEEALNLVMKYDFVSGMFIWTGFDYLGEPTPYGWPSRSSYFGIVDLAGFPKDVYYLYKSQWTNDPVLHIFPHWNWKKNQTVDVWAFTNCDEVELFLNGKSMGVRKKAAGQLHLMWRLVYEPGTLKAVGRKGGRVLTEEVRTAGAASHVVLGADRKVIAADGRDLSFVTVRVVDDQGTLVPDADNLVRFKVSGGGRIAGVDNGSETDLGSFKADARKTFNGLALVVVQTGEKPGTIRLEASSEGLKSATIVINAR